MNQHIKKKKNYNVAYQKVTNQSTQIENNKENTDSSLKISNIFLQNNQIIDVCDDQIKIQSLVGVNQIKHYINLHQKKDKNLYHFSLKKRISQLNPLGPPRQANTKRSQTYQYFNKDQLINFLPKTLKTLNNIKFPQKKLKYVDPIYKEQITYLSSYTYRPKINQKVQLPILNEISQFHKAIQHNKNYLTKWRSFQQLVSQHRACQSVSNKKDKIIQKSLFERIENFRNKIEIDNQNSFRQKKQNIFAQIWPKILRTNKSMNTILQNKNVRIKRNFLECKGMNKLQKQLKWIDSKQQNGYSFKFHKHFKNKQII